MGQMIFTLWAGAFVGFVISHIGEDIFVNAMVAGMGDGLANATSGMVAQKYGLLVAYRGAALLCLILNIILGGFRVRGSISYWLVFLMMYCLGCCLNWATAVAVDQTQPD